MKSSVLRGTAAGVLVFTVWAATAEETLDPIDPAAHAGDPALIPSHSAEEEIRQCMARYYGALNRMLAGNTEPLRDLWSHAPDVSLMGPDGGCDLGWKNVLARYETGAGRGLPGHLEPRNIQIQVSGDVACVSPLDHGKNFLVGGRPVTLDFRSTKVLRRKQDGWRIVHSHVDPTPELAPSGVPEQTRLPTR